MAGDFKLAELVRPCRRWKAARTPDVTYQSQQLCWNCANVYGGCEWSARFEPVPGWDAIATTRTVGGKFVEKSFSVRACPMDVFGDTEINCNAQPCIECKSNFWLAEVEE